jgi:hypothetical protein
MCDVALRQKSITSLVAFSAIMQKVEIHRGHHDVTFKLKQCTRK